MAPVLAVVRLVAAAPEGAALTPLERMWNASRPGRAAQFFRERVHGSGEQSDQQINPNEKANAQTTKRSGTEDLVRRPS